MRLGRKTFVRTLSHVSLFWVLVCSSPLTFADEPVTLQLTVKQAYQGAVQLMHLGKFQDALALLRPLTDAYPEQLEMRFQRGMAAMGAAHQFRDPDEQKIYLNEAVEQFRTLLDHNPDLHRPRLELARALFLRGQCTQPPEDLWAHFFGDDCDSAARHFRQVLAGDAPPEVIANVNRFLQPIRVRKRFNGYFSLALAPDTNINSATQSHTINVVTPFGRLPFSLGEDARETSGVGVLLSASEEYWHPLQWRPFDSVASRWLFGSQLYMREYEGHRFDDMDLSLRSGPRLFFQGTDISVQAKVSQRWFGGTVYSKGFGLRIDNNWYLGRRTWLGGSLERMQLRHRDEGLGKAPRWNADLRVLYSLTPNWTAGTRGGWVRSRPERVHQRSETWWGGFEVRAESLSIFGIRGFGLDLSHDWHFTDYDQQNFLLSPDRQKNRLQSSRITVHNRRLQYNGFSPTISFVRQRQRSNIELSEYSRSRLELSVRRLF